MFTSPTEKSLKNAEYRCKDPLEDIEEAVASASLSTVKKMISLSQDYVHKYTKVETFSSCAVKSNHN